VPGEEADAVLAGLGEEVETKLNMLLNTAPAAWTGCKDQTIGDSVSEAVQPSCS
jgi:hypothetical protein